jgi:hypothetical protein
VGHGISPLDHDYWKDQERIVPSIKVQTIGSGRLFFGPLSRSTGPRKLRNRHGNVTFRKVYA